MLHQTDILPKTDKTGIPVYILKFQNRQYGEPQMTYYNAPVTFLQQL